MRDLVRAAAFVAEYNFLVSHGKNRLEAARIARIVANEAGDAWDHAEENSSDEDE